MYCHQSHPYYRITVIHSHCPQVCHTDTELSLMPRFTAGAGAGDWWPTPYTEGVAGARACDLLSLFLRGETMLLRQLQTRDLMEDS